jgi:hypothetical protein
MLNILQLQPEICCVIYKAANWGFAETGIELGALLAHGVDNMVWLDRTNRDKNNCAAELRATLSDAKASCLTYLFIKRRAFKKCRNI